MCATFENTDQSSGYIPGLAHTSSHRGKEGGVLSIRVENRKRVNQAHAMTYSEVGKRVSIDIKINGNTQGTHFRDIRITE